MNDQLDEKRDRKIDELYQKEAEELAQVLATRHQLPYIDLSKIAINTDALRMVPLLEAREAGLAVFRVTGRVIHVAIMSAVNQKQDMRAWITEITKNLKGYAKSLNVPIICLSQLSRLNEKENRAPRLSDIRESGSCEQDADIVMFIHNPKPDVMVKSMDKLGKYVTLSEAENIRELIVAKNREGETGKIFLFWQKEITLFSTLDY